MSEMIEPDCLGQKEDDVIEEVLEEVVDDGTYSLVPCVRLRVINTVTSVVAANTGGG